MNERNFQQMLQAQWVRGKFACVGLDSDIWKIPAAHVAPYSKYRNAAQLQLLFNCAIIKATMDLVCAYKPNIAFYEALGQEGLWALNETIECINKSAPEVPVILDAKRADIGNTNDGYVNMAFNHFKADAITLHPYLGAEALQPFLDQKDKGIFVLCRTSNKGASEFQDAMLDPLWIKHQHDGAYEYFSLKADDRCIPMYQYVAWRIAHTWNEHGNCGVVVGATYPQELECVRQIVDEVPILIPGVGAQGGDLEASVKAAKQHFIVNSSRGIIFASHGPDFAEAARRETEKLHNLITQYR